MAYHIPVFTSSRAEVRSFKSISEARKEAVEWIDWIKDAMGSHFGPSVKVYGAGMRAVGTVSFTGREYVWNPAPTAANKNPESVPITKSGGTRRRSRSRHRNPPKPLTPPIRSLNPVLDPLTIENPRLRIYDLNSD